MAIATFVAGTHRAAAPIPGAMPPSIDDALAIVINPMDYRTRTVLVGLLDEIEECLATDKRVLHSLPANDAGEAA